MSVVRIMERKYMRILLRHWKLSVIKRCPYQRGVRIGEGSVPRGSTVVTETFEKRALL